MLTGSYAKEAEVFDQQVVPRYLRTVFERVQGVLAPAQSAAVVHLGCRTGALDAELAQRAGAASLVGFDTDDAVEIARTKNPSFEYTSGPSLPTGLPAGGFSHAVSVHPLTPSPGERQALLSEARRLLVEGGQFVLGLPLRGSFQEIFDLLREYALHHDVSELSKTIEASSLARPNLERLTEELETVGFDEVDVEFHRLTIPYGKGGGFFDDPTARLLILPDIEAALGGMGLAEGLRYARSAAEKYWAESPFELSLNLGCASARRY